MHDYQRGQFYQFLDRLIYLYPQLLSNVHALKRFPGDQT